MTSERPVLPNATLLSVDCFGGVFSGTCLRDREFLTLPCFGFQVGDKGECR